MTNHGMVDKNNKEGLNDPNSASFVISGRRGGHSRFAAGILRVRTEEIEMAPAAAARAVTSSTSDPKGRLN